MTGFFTAREALQTTFQIITNSISGNPPQGISSGYSELDSVLGGFQKGKLLVLASRPGIGKTALTLNIVRNMLTAEKPKRILYCSGEQDEIEVMSRLLCLEAQISIMEIIDELKPASAEKLAEAASSWKDLPFWIHPCCGAAVSDLVEKICEFFALHPMDMVVIDSLEFLNFPNTADAIAALKALAVKLNVPILLLVTARSRRAKITIADIPSGIVDPADSVLILDRSHEMAKDDTPENGSAVQLYVEKNRLGYTGLISFRFFPATMLFAEVPRDSDAALGASKLRSLS